jgi:hypothetical protein
MGNLVDIRVHRERKREFETKLATAFADLFRIAYRYEPEAFRRILRQLGARPPWIGAMQQIYEQERQPRR